MDHVDSRRLVDTIGELVSPDQLVPRTSMEQDYLLATTPRIGRSSNLKMTCMTRQQACAMPPPLAAAAPIA
jgi:hypothetical protein